MGDFGTIGRIGKTILPDGAEVTGSFKVGQPGKSNFHIENIDFFTLLEDAVVIGEVGNTFESFEFVRDSNNEIVLSS